MDLRQIDDVTVSRLDLVAHLMEAGRWREARKAVSTACSEHHSAHDGYRNSVARVLSLILTKWGQAAVEEFREAHGAWPDFQPLCDESFRTQVEIVAGVNHMHLSSFRLIEDSSKVTLLYEPCGSGGRLINDGAYYGTREYPLTLMRQPSNSTFGEKDFPVYCNHCSEMTGTILANGGSCFLVEGWTTDHRYGGCRMHVFKSLSAVPDEFFHRTGVDRNEVPEKKAQKKRCHREFSPRRNCRDSHDQYLFVWRRPSKIAIRRKHSSLLRCVTEVGETVCIPRTGSGCRIYMTAFGDNTVATHLTQFSLAPLPNSMVPF